MEARELRLGNYVTITKEVNSESLEYMQDCAHSFDDVEGVLYFNIVKISCDEVELFIGQCYQMGFCPSKIDPIKLTEKWIDKLGLKRMPESEYTLDSYDLAGFKLWMNKGMFLFNDKINIEYVHQLQNLYFQLTGNELDLKD